MSRKAYSGASVSLADFKQLSLLGEGAYSAVYKVLRLADREIYALKKVKLPSLSDKEKQNALNEVRLLASVQQPSIIAYKEAFFDEKTRCLCIVQEYADGGDLFQQIVKCQKERTHIREPDVWRFIDGMCQGLKALHDMRILHRDLKCANVFLHNGQEGLIAKLGDFNVSKVAKRGLCMTQTGTPYYASPEVWRDMPYDAKSDMWSLGCVIYEMVALRPPFRAEDMEGLYRKVLRGQYPRIPPHYSHDLAEVIGSLLQVNPRHRPSVDQLLQMPVMRRHGANSSSFDSESARSLDLLSTIKLPKNAIDLSLCLPKPRYDLPKMLVEEDSSHQDSSHLGGDSNSRLDSAQQRGLTKAPSVARVDRADRLPGVAPKGAGRDDPLEDEPYEQYSGVEPIRHQADLQPDSLDAYLSQAHRPPPPPPVRQPRAEQQWQHPQNDPDGQPDRAPPPPPQERERHARQEPPPPEYGQGRLPQYNPQAYQGGAPSASPAPSAAVRGAQRGQQYRQQQRRPMASYARPQYALGTPSSQQPTQTPAPQGGDGRDRGLRLPRIFSRAT
mmetsp:Transcript_93842/g.201490  ORF Transcript_93842/g.201490 Transcript_93842/m.201490 type:complete len:556 (-) Transcript_93842:275-1942(-)